MADHYREDRYIDLTNRLEEIDKEISFLEHEKSNIEGHLEDLSEVNLDTAYIARCQELGV